jgi:hypothetical protein
MPIKIPILRHHSDVLPVPSPPPDRARAAIGFMVWLWISAVIVLARGELNADPEHQTARKWR